MDIYLEHDSLFVRIGKNIAWLKPDQYDWFKIYQRDKEGTCGYHRRDLASNSARMQTEK